MPFPIRFRALAAALVLVPALAAAAHGQCMLANPSFEVYSGSFGGWNAFGTVGASVNAVHGRYSASVDGPNSGTWNVSGLWQTMTCAPGQTFTISAWALNSSAAPLAGGSQGILNVEWRDASNTLISYESHAIVTAASPVDVWQPWSGTSAAAPAGTASIHFVLGVLQGPTDARPRVLFDEAYCISTGPPTLETLQWGDFGSGRTVSFSGRTWRVKGPGYLGPGPNLFDNSSAAAWVDSAGQLNLTIHKIGSSWYSSEVALTDVLGYGDYVFTTRGRYDLLDPNTVFGMFLWEYGPCYDTGYLWWNPYNEIDVEIGRWGSAAAADEQFVAQPASISGNVYRFNVTPGDTQLVSHAMRWLPHRVEYRCWRGGPNDESAASLVTSWAYTGGYIPRPEMPRVHINLWQLKAPAVTQSVIVNAFTYVPTCPDPPCAVLGVGGDAPPPAAALAPAAPNPFGAGTTIRFELARAADAELAVYDLAGRQVRRLVAGALAAGPHAVAWDGRDDAGRRANAGVYFYRLRTDGRTEARRVVLLP